MSPNSSAGGTTLAGALVDATRRLAAAGVQTPRVDAELLLRHVTGWPRTRLLLEANSALDSQVRDRWEALLHRRERREPLQLLLGAVGFRHLDIAVRPGVFIPRPETEVLAGEAISRVRQGGVVVEPCTGTGAIACSVALESRASVVVATDLSLLAVELARENALRAGVEVTNLLGDLLDPVSPALRGRVDVLVSNPPYLAPGEVEAAEPEVALWDPHEALVAGPTGHEITDLLIAAAPEWLAPGGWLLLEVASSRAHEAAERARAAGLERPEVLADLAGADRIVAARAPH